MASVNSPSQPPLQNAREGRVLIGKYRLGEMIGKGGMGEVFRARNVLIDRDVAIKILRAEHATNADTVVRFLREARTANIVRHPHVLDVLDVGIDEHNVPFMVQELLEGEDLHHFLERSGGKLSVDAALALLLPVIDALAVAHARGVAHRDLKPENIFLHHVDECVVPKILDFGISRVVTHTEEERITSDAFTIGTLPYMPPEQIDNLRSADARADVWAIGVILYETLTGTSPFRGSTRGALLVQVYSVDPIPIETALPGIHPDLARVVSRCLRRDPNERYPTAAELARDLRHIREAKAIEPTRKLAAVQLTDLPESVPPQRVPKDSLRPPGSTLAERAPTTDAGPARGSSWRARVSVGLGIVILAGATAFAVKAALAEAPHAAAAPAAPARR